MDKELKNKIIKVAHILSDKNVYIDDAKFIINIIEEQQNKIDKAIEHLEESINFYLKSDEEKVISIDSVKERYLHPVLEILKGEDK